MEQYGMCELCFKGKQLEDNWAQVNLWADLSCGDAKVKVPGFYAGDGNYKIRFMPETAGNWQYRISGCIEAEGMVEVVPADGKHGMVRTEGLHFCYQDGKLFYPFGTTVYALMHQEDWLVEETMESLHKSPFNKVRFCVFPKHYDYNHNEPGLYAFEKKEDGSWDVNRPCTAFWDRLDDIIRRMDEMEIQADLILFHPYDRWGFAKLSQKENLIYLDYLLRRLAAMPNVWWSLANEYDLCTDKTMEDWEEIECFVAEHDTGRHLLSSHNCFKTWDFSRQNITHASIQSKILTKVLEWRNQYQKPVVIDECCYEGNLQHVWGSISGREMTNRFWRVMVMGGYCTHGETFLDAENEILWWAKGGRLKGESPERIAFLRKLVEGLPGPIDPCEFWIYDLLKQREKGEEGILKKVPTESLPFVKAMLQMGDDMKEFCTGEFIYQGHCEKDAYITFYDLRTCAQDVLNLPEEYTYKIELIDTWEMSQTVLVEKASGRTEISLPGKEGMAVLALKQN